MAYIDKSFITDLISRVDIVEVIQSYQIHLKAAGRNNYTACCPFHDENTPSFTVSPSKQFYHCFGCGAHGTAVGFVMEYERLSYPEAIESLANKFGFEVIYEQVGSKSQPLLSQHKKGPDLYQYLLIAANFYQKQLSQSPFAQNYLVDRGLEPTIIQRFMLGYAPIDGRQLLQQFEVSDYPHLQRVGLLSQRDGQHYSKFRERIIFPIRDQRGRVIGFGGRLIANKDSHLPKYLNSPETPIFHKGSVIYGLYEASKASRNLNQLIVVEGYMDVIALAQCGIDYAVASMGTAMTPRQLSILLNYTDTIIFCFDGDKAGQNAAEKALSVALPLMQGDKQIKFMFLPQEHDPDSYVKKNGQKAFLSLMTQAKGIGSFCFTLWQQNLDLQLIDDRARFGERAKREIERIPKGTFKDLMSKKLGDLIRLSEDEFNHLQQKNSRVSYKEQIKHSYSSAVDTADRLPIMGLTIAILIQNPDLVHQIPPDMSLHFENLANGYLLIALIEQLKADGSLSTAALIECWREQEQEYQLLSQLAARKIEHSELVRVFLDSLKELQKMSVNQELQQLIKKMKTQELTKEEKHQLLQLQLLSKNRG